MHPRHRPEPSAEVARLERSATLREAPFCSAIQPHDLGYIFPARRYAPPCHQRADTRRRAREPPTPVLPSVERATPRARGDNFDGSGYDARGAAGLRATITPRDFGTWTRRRHFGHSITTRLFAPCSFVAPRPTFRQTCINFLGEVRGTSTTSAAGRQKPRRPALPAVASTPRALSRRSHEAAPRASMRGTLTIICSYGKPCFQHGTA